MPALTDEGLWPARDVARLGSLFPRTFSGPDKNMSTPPSDSPPGFTPEQPTAGRPPRRRVEGKENGDSPTISPAKRRRKDDEALLQLPRANTGMIC